MDTTRNQLGLAMQTFMEHPDQWRLLAERPELGPAAVEEVMRVNPTVTWVTREALEDIEFEGLEIARGTTIHLLSGAAGSDPRAFPEPAFDITAERPPSHFGFGGGVPPLHRPLRRPRATWPRRCPCSPPACATPARTRRSAPLPRSGNTGPIELPIAFEPASSA